MKRQVYTLGFQSANGNNTPIVLDYNTNENLYTSELNHDKVISESDVKEVVLYSKVDGEFIIMDAQFKEIGRVENFMDVFNTDKRFIEVFAYTCHVDENDENGDVIGTHAITIYTPNLEVADDIAHYVAYNNIEGYSENEDNFYIWDINDVDFVGENNPKIQKDEMLGWVADFIDEDEHILIYPSDNKEVDARLIEDDVYVNLSKLYDGYDRFYVPMEKLGINQIVEIALLCDWSYNG